MIPFEMEHYLIVLDKTVFPNRYEEQDKFAVNIQIFSNVQIYQRYFFKFSYSKFNYQFGDIYIRPLYSIHHLLPYLPMSLPVGGLHSIIVEVSLPTLLRVSHKHSFWALSFLISLRDHTTFFFSILSIIVSWVFILRRISLLGFLSKINMLTDSLR